jgi:hypothetical protein
MGTSYTVTTILGFLVFLTSMLAYGFVPYGNTSLGGFDTKDGAYMKFTWNTVTFTPNVTASVAYTTVAEYTVSTAMSSVSGWNLAMLFVLCALYLIGFFFVDEKNVNLGLTTILAVGQWVAWNNILWQLTYILGNHSYSHAMALLGCNTALIAVYFFAERTADTMAGVNKRVTPAPIKDTENQTPPTSSKTTVSVQHAHLVGLVVVIACGWATIVPAIIQPMASMPYAHASGMMDLPSVWVGVVSMYLIDQFVNIIMFIVNLYAIMKKTNIEDYASHGGRLVICHVTLAVNVLVAVFVPMSALALAGGSADPI